MQSVILPIDFPGVVVTFGHCQLAVRFVYPVANPPSGGKIERRALHRKHTPRHAFVHIILGNAVGIHPQHLIKNITGEVSTKIEERMIGGIQHGRLVSFGFIKNGQFVVIRQSVGDG